MITNKNNSYHFSFLKFLEEGNSYKGSDGQLIVDFVEKELLSFLRQHLSRELSSLYDVFDTNIIEEWIKEVLGSPTLTNMNNACNGIKYTEGLTWYKRFLESEYNPEVIARKEAEKERLKQELKELRKKEKEKKQEELSPDDNQTRKVSSGTKRIKKQELDENQREGAITQVSITRRERNQKLRQACLKKYGYICQCCGIDFEKIYGEIGKEFIEVHHLFPISQTEGEHDLDPEKDLIPLCSNCHSMIHRLDGEEMTLENLKSYYQGYDYQKDKVDD